jgi:hypothetical protein
VAGRVRVRLRRHGRTLARGGRRVPAGIARTVRVRFTRAGRRRARRAAPFSARLVVRLPGESRTRVVRVRIVR